MCYWELQRYCKSKCKFQNFWALGHAKNNSFCNIYSITTPAWFFQRRLTLTNLLELDYHVHTGFSNKLQTDIVHNLLIYKLDSMGFPSTLLKWISSYLHDRTQKVYFNNTLPKNITLFSGVPQGSHSGPMILKRIIL